MPTIVTDPYTVAANALEQIILTEFNTEGIVAYHDKLHESRGHNGTEIGISPARIGPKFNNAAVQETTVTVQFYGVYDLEIDPTQQVDPRIITGYFARFQAAVEAAQATQAGTNAVWYFQVVGCEFPDDPTGNKSRFEATVRAFGDNQALYSRL